MENFNFTFIFYMVICFFFFKFAHLMIVGFVSLHFTGTYLYSFLVGQFQQPPKCSSKTIIHRINVL